MAKCFGFKLWVQRPCGQGCPSFAIFFVLYRISCVFYSMCALDKPLFLMAFVAHQVLYQWKSLHFSWQPTLQCPVGLRRNLQVTMYSGVWTQAQTLISRFICYFPPSCHLGIHTFLKTLHKCFISTITIKSVGDGRKFTSLHHTIIHGTIVVQLCQLYRHAKIL